MRTTYYIQQAAQALEGSVSFDLLRPSRDLSHGGSAAARRRFGGGSAAARRRLGGGSAAGPHTRIALLPCFGWAQWRSGAVGQWGSGAVGQWGERRRATAPTRAGAPRRPGRPHLHFRAVTGAARWRHWRHWRATGATSTKRNHRQRGNKDPAPMSESEQNFRSRCFLGAGKLWIAAEIVPYLAWFLLPHPQHSNGNSHMALGDRRSELAAAGSALGCARGRHPQLGLAVRCGARSHATKKNIPLCFFFTCSQNTEMAPF